MRFVCSYFPAALLIMVSSLQAGPESKIQYRLQKFCERLRTQTRSHASAPLSSHSTRLVRVKDEGLVQVYVYLKQADEAALEALEEQGLELEIVNRSLKIVKGWMPYQKLEAVAALEGVRRLRAPIYGRPRAGSVTSEGDAIHRAPEVRDQGYTGSGIRVGVISDGVDAMQEAIASDDLPANIEVAIAGYDDEGVAMLEIIHDLAPGASLAFSAGNDTLQFIRSITRLRNLGCRIIVDDIGFPEEPFFEDGTVAKAAQEAADAGIIFISAAGNGAEDHYEADFSGLGARVIAAGTADQVTLNDVHDFGGGDYRCRVLVPSSGGTVTFQWSSPFDAARDDYDLYLVAEDDSRIIASSTDPQDGNDDPIEVLEIGYLGGLTQADLVINRASGSRDRRLEFFLESAPGLSDFSFQDDFNVKAGSIFGHPAAVGVMAVAAISAGDSGWDDIESFSSQGPVLIFSPFQATRSKPEIAGIDNVAITGVGGFGSPFSGTSAAAPHIAAIAALLLEADPTLVRNQIVALIQNNAVELGAAGIDPIFGSGRADAMAALEALLAGEIPAAVNPSGGGSSGGSSGGGGGCVVQPNGKPDPVFLGLLAWMLLYAAWRARRIEG